MPQAHTPGAWSIDPCRHPDYKEKAHNLFDHDGIPIATIKWNGIDKEEKEANANLIAAAPELLEALEGLTAFLKDYPHPCEVDISGYLEHAEAAISAAKGKAHA